MSARDSSSAALSVRPMNIDRYCDTVPALCPDSTATVPPRRARGKTVARNGKANGGPPFWWVGLAPDQFARAVRLRERQRQRATAAQLEQVRAFMASREEPNV